MKPITVNSKVKLISSVVLQDVAGDPSTSHENIIDADDPVKFFIVKELKIVHETNWAKVEGINIDAKGFLKLTKIILTENEVPSQLEPIAGSDFALSCVDQAISDEVNAAALVAVGYAETGSDWDIQNGEFRQDGFVQFKGPTTDGFGPFRFFRDEWLKLTEDSHFTLQDLSHVHRNIGGMALIASEAVSSISENLNRGATTFDYYMRHILGSEFIKLVEVMDQTKFEGGEQPAGTSPRESDALDVVMKDVFQQVYSAEQIDAIINRRNHLFKFQSGQFKTLGQFFDDIVEKLNEGLSIVPSLFLEADELTNVVTSMPNSTVSVPNINEPNSKANKIAKTIVNQFAAADRKENGNNDIGLKERLSVALANAWAESKFQADAHNPVGENSIGLFQLNLDGGVGSAVCEKFGSSMSNGCEAEFKIGEKNVKWLIKAINGDVPKVSHSKEFWQKTNIDDAMKIFVKKILRPKNTDEQIIKRTPFARAFLSQNPELLIEAPPSFIGVVASLFGFGSRQG